MDHPALETVTLIVPYYRNCAMLARQIQEWNEYPPDLRVVLVDDGSPEPAAPIVRLHASNEALERIAVYRIKQDIPWNREGARNLGTKVTKATRWVVHVDIDHLLPKSRVRRLLKFRPTPGRWYRFPRWRVGQADETRRKDAIPEDSTFGPIHPHIDSYLVERSTYWAIGGYDEDFAGCLGGGTDFLKRLEAHAGAPLELPAEIPLHVHTRHAIADASDWSLSRDRSEGKRRAAQKRTSGRVRPESSLRFEWERVL